MAHYNFPLCGLDFIVLFPASCLRCLLLFSSSKLSTKLCTFLDQLGVKRKIANKTFSYYVLYKQWENEKKNANARRKKRLRKTISKNEARGVLFPFFPFHGIDRPTFDVCHRYTTTFSVPFECGYVYFSQICILNYR